MSKALLMSIAIMMVLGAGFDKVDENRYSNETDRRIYAGIIAK